MADVGEVKYKVKLDDSGLESDINQTQNDISKGMNKTASASQAAANLIASGYAAKISSAVINAGTSLAKFGLQYSMQMESYQTNFAALLGDAEKAQTLVNNLKEMAAKTPFATRDLADASQTLLAFGVSAENLMPTIEMLGDVSMGNKERFQSLALAFGQVSAAGKLTGQDLLQFVNAGFNPLKEISQKTGESLGEVRKRMEEGGVSAQEVAEAFKSATSEGGQFAGAMDNASQTLEGRWSTLKDNAAEAAGAMMESLIPALKKIVDWLSQAASWISQNQGAATAIGAVILVLVTSLSLLSGVFSVASAAAAIFGVSVSAAFSTILIVVGVIAALIAAGVLLYQNWDTISAKAKEIWQGISDFLSGLIDSIASWFQEKWNSLMTWWRGLLQSISDWFKNTWNSLSNWFSNIVSNIASWFQSKWNSIVNTFKNLWQNIPSFFSNLWSDILSIVKSIPDKFLSIGKNIVQGLWNGISSGWSWLKNKVKSLASSLIDTAKSVLGIHSPSTEFEWVGKMSGKGWEKGFDKEFDNLDDIIKVRFGNLLSGASSYSLPSLPTFQSASRAIQIKGATVSQPVQTTVVLDIDGREVARATAWRMGEQLSWEEM